MKLAQQFATFLLIVSKVLGKPRYGKLVSVEGEEVAIGCDVDVDDDSLIVWKHGARVLFAGNLRIRRDYRMAVLRKKLIISRVELGDAGVYSCETETMSGEVVMSTSHLSVLSPPRVHVSGSQHGYVSVKAGSLLRVKCTGVGVPTPAVSWWYGDTMVTRAVVGGAVLTLDSVSSGDSGQYQCRADNGVGKPAMDTLILNVLAPPSISMSIARCGEPCVHLSPCEVTIHCHVSTSSPATVKWWLDGQLLLHSSTVSDGTNRTESLVVDTCEHMVGSQVTCEVENMLGLTRDRVSLSPPVQDISLRSLPLTSSSSSDLRQLLLPALAPAFLLFI